MYFTWKNDQFVHNLEAKETVFQKKQILIQNTFICAKHDLCLMQ